MRPALILVALLAGCGSVDPCSDGISDGDESDVDCGGSCPQKCNPGQLCFVNNDCTAGICAAGGHCPMPSCTDQLKNGSETDIDCGGGACPGCGSERLCKVATDCASLSCMNGRCTADPQCSDGKLDGDESDVDCGGSCDPCADGKSCMGPGDCMSAMCTDGLCGGDPCSDGKRDGDESDVDCGGSCDGCKLGQLCGGPADCAQGVCSGGVCSTPKPLTLDFMLSTRVPTGINGSGYIASGDFNGDKKTDVVVVWFNQAAVLLGDGKGGLGVAQETDVSGQVESIAVADFNGDGKSDLVVGPINGNPMVVLGSQSGKLGGASYLMGIGDPVLLMAADVTGDKRADIVAVDQPNDQSTPATAIVFVGAGNGTFQPNPPLDLGLQPYNGTIADFNHDGKKDLLFANAGDANEMNGSFQVLFGQGGGDFAQPVSTDVHRPRLVVAGDWNGDGRGDLFYLANSFFIYTALGNVDGSFKAPVQITDPNSVEGIGAADFDLDGHLDLVVADGLSAAMGLVSIYLGKGDGTFQTPTSFPHVGGPVAMVVADFDGDGKPDVATTDDMMRVNVFLNTSN